MRNDLDGMKCCGSNDSVEPFRTKSAGRGIATFIRHWLERLVSKSNIFENGPVPRGKFSDKWRSMGENDGVRALAVYREMAKRHGLIWSYKDFSDGEILVIDDGTNAVRLGGVASSFFYDLFELDTGALTRGEFLHRYPFANDKREAPPNCDARKPKTLEANLWRYRRLPPRSG